MTTRILIVMSGGCVQSVLATQPYVEAEILDYDDIESGGYEGEPPDESEFPFEVL